MTSAERLKMCRAHHITNDASTEEAHGPEEATGWARHATMRIRGGWLDRVVSWVVIGSCLSLLCYSLSYSFLRDYIATLMLYETT
jgi:hypothetical protein